ncbi:MAG: protein serine/threonine phosphatase [Ilumatobacteraceae bacterium]|nr:protein serine/threonine phosphatase [Ilumatobacteraceae bacterium]
MDQLGHALSVLVGDAEAIEPHRLIELVDHCAGLLGAEHAAVWLADHQKRTLVHLAVADSRERLPIDGSLAGRAFITSEAVADQAEEGGCVWIPLLTGVERVGVLEVATAEPAPDVAALRAFAAVVAAELVAANQYTDLFTRTRRQQPMSLAAEMQWASLPPASFATKAVHIAGMMEPAYDVGGDTFDYAHSDGLLSFAILDAVGHSLDSSMTSSLALGAYRNARRHERSLSETASAMDAVIKGQLGRGRFVTGQLALLDTPTGELRWLNAGHPLPLLIRQGKVIGHLECVPRPPFGLGHIVPGVEPEIATAQLEPGDAVLLYSDGVVEHRTSDGVDYGIERLKGSLESAFAARMSPAETLRRLANSILDFHGGDLHDDATTVLVVWQHDAIGGAGS